jgi:hypothetical protein
MLTPKIFRKAASEYLREASVLVGVFGVLDYLLKPEAASAAPWVVDPGRFTFLDILVLRGFILRSEG